MQPIDRFYDSVGRNPGAVAITGSRRLTYAELHAEVMALAAAFQDFDSTPGSRVGICATNSVDHLVSLLATYAAGKVWVPLNPRNARAELNAMIAATSPSILLNGSEVRGNSVAELVSRYGEKRPRRIERGAEDAQIIKFSGGSTGTPKPVVQPLRCVNAQADGIRDFFDFHAGDVNLIAAPLTHGASCFVLPVLEVGGSHVLLESAKAVAIVDAIVEHGVTTMYAPPTLLYSLVEYLEEHPLGSYSLRHVIYSAAPMPPQRIRDCQRVLGPVIETAYGQVEAPQIVAAMRADELLLEENLVSVGRPSAVARVAIMDTDGELLPVGEVGEIVVAGPLLMSGYLDRTEETARTIIDGWLHTGDLGTIDGRGYLFISGRLREVINTGGFKVFPGDVEAALARHTAVAECAVFGVADPKWGEAVNAAVVVRPQANVTPEELAAWVKAELGSVKAPKKIWLVDQLPRNAAGKVSRSAVRAALLR